MRKKKLIRGSSLLVLAVFIATLVTQMALASEVPINQKGAVIAYDDFSSYTNQDGVLLQDITYESGEHGSGFGINWSKTQPNFTKFSGDTNVNFKNVAGKGMMLNYASANPLYRTLSNPVDFSSTNGKYEFSISMSDYLAIRSAGFRLQAHAENVDFRYRVGSNDLYFGYKYQIDPDGNVDSSETYKMYPQLCVGGTLYELTDFAVANTYVYGTDSTATFYTYRLVVELCDGADKVKLYRELMGNSTTAELVKEVSSELSGTTCGYIAIQSGAMNRIANVGVNRLPDDMSSYESYKALDTVALDTFTEYDAAPRHNLKNYTYDDSITYGKGFAFNWSSSPTAFTNGGSQWDYYVVFQNNNVLNITTKNLIYRKLAEPINFTATSGKAAFSVDAVDTMSKINRPANPVDFAYFIGSNDFCIGYRYDTDYTKMIPYIKVGEYEESIENQGYTLPDAGADVTKDDMRTFRLEITFKDGADDLALYFYKAGSEKPSEPILKTSVELNTRECNYVGLRAATKAGANVKIDNVAVESEKELYLVKSEQNAENTAMYDWRMVSGFNSDVKLTFLIAAYSSTGELQKVIIDPRTITANSDTLTQSIGFDGTTNILPVGCHHTKMFIWSDLAKIAPMYGVTD